MEVQFDKFAKQHIVPIEKKIEECQLTNCKLQEELNICIKRINQLEITVRQSNLIFSNVPTTSYPNKAVEDIRINHLKICRPVPFEKVVDIKSNREKQTSTLLVVFGSRKTTDQIMRNAKYLKGTQIGVSRDLSKEARETKNKLLMLRRKILNTGTTLNIKVYGSNIVIDKIKLTLENNCLYNETIDGKQYIFEKFNINVDEVLDTNKQ